MCWLINDNELQNSRDLNNGNATVGFIKSIIPNERTSPKTTMDPLG
jgi:hypothetical protein